MNQLTQTLFVLIVITIIAISLRYLSPPPAPKEDNRDRLAGGAMVAQVKSIGKVISDRGTHIAVEFNDGRKTNVLPEQIAPIRLAHSKEN